MISAATIWGTWVLILASVTLPSIYVLPITFTSSGLALFAYIMASGRRQAFFRMLSNRRFARLLAWVALLEVTQTSLYFISYSIAIQDGASVVIPIIRSLAGILTPLLATISVNERASKTYLVYGTLSSIGTIIMFSRGGITAGEDLSYIALIMVVASLLIRSWFYLEQRKVAQEMVSNGYNATHVLTAHFLIGIVILAFVSFFYTISTPLSPPENLISQIGLLALFGLTHTGLGSLLRLIAMKQITAQQSIIIMYLEPLLAVLLSILFLGETVTLEFLIGAGLILFSAGATSLHSSKHIAR